MDIYEVVLKEFDGGTDKIDNLILWIASNEQPHIVEGSSQVKSVGLLHSLNIDSAGIDLVIGEYSQFMNYYKCSECEEEWKDKWNCMCNDHCPNCHAEIEPYKSEEV